MKTKNKLWLLSIIFASALAGLTGCSGGNNDGEEWYGVGLDVDLNSRTSFLVGEKPNASMFNFTAYDNGEEVEVKPEDIKIEPNRSLELSDKQLTFKWRKYSTTLDIDVSDTLISECELMEKAAFKYEEPEHDAIKSDGTPDTRSAFREGKNMDDGSMISYLCEVSYGSSFSYSIDVDNEGDELYLFASVASNNYMWGRVSEKYETGFHGTNALPLSEIVQISNNGTVFECKKSADIKSTVVTEQDMDIHYTGESIPWFTVVDLATKNFKRHWLGKVTLEKGINNIRLDLNQKKVSGGSFAYQELSCGNWDNIEVRYVKKGTDIKEGDLQIATYPKQEYIVGEKFSLDGAYFYLENKEGLANDIDMSKVTISNTNPLTPNDTSIELTYNGQKVIVPINVKTKIIGELASDDSIVQYIEPEHNRDGNNNIVTDQSQIDNREAKKGNTLKGERFLENVSAYGKFKYTYESGRTHGKFDIYANVASNGIIGGDVSMIWPEAQGGFVGSQSIDFTKILTLKNNDKVYPINEGAIIPETHLTSEMDPATIGQEEQIKESAWSACTYFLLNNFKRIHLGTVDIVEGTNEIELDIGYLFGGFGYASSMCGNWKNIEIIYTDDTTNNEITSIEMAKAPRLEYAIGETFSLDGAKFVGYNKDGVEVETIDNSKIEILDNSKLIADKTINLRYKGVDFSVDVKVSNVVVQEFTTLDVNNMNIKYIEMSTDDHKAQVQGTYIDKVSKDSYFEYEIESDKERTITVYAEVATNAYINKGEAGYEDYDTGIEGFTQSYIGSYDLDLSKSVKMTNTVNGNDPIEFKVNEDAIAYGHVINATDDGEIAKSKYIQADGSLNQWGMADDLCMRQFRNIKLGEVKLSAGKNVIRLTMQGYLQKNSFAFEGYACGNWKSITIEF